MPFTLVLLGAVLLMYLYQKSWMDIGIIVYDIETEFQNLQRPFLKHLDQVPV